MRGALGIVLSESGREAMSGASDSTIPNQPIPSVVIVSPAPGMLDIWLEVLQSLEDVPSIQLADLSSVATAVARWRPIAILVEQELFEFDEQEFGELARDVNAELIAVEARAGKEAVAAAVLPKLRAAQARWHDRNATEVAADG